MASYDATYNPEANSGFDDAAFTGGDNAEDIASGVRGADTSFERTAREDRDAAETHSHERPSKFEVENTLADVRDNERNVRGGTRGKKVDAFKQEREVDRAVDLASQPDEL
ncbi:hypothetical protein BC834DRAFT_593041 [Gloeopeniophorella convolvens]|nr:hypothetical protein BC834DRAFT_593041 [Gloeopeniophorella convolvens]